jgi:hypothetical protein
MGIKGMVTWVLASLLMVAVGMAIISRVPFLRQLVMAA